MAPAMVLPNHARDLEAAGPPTLESAATASSYSASSGSEDPNASGAAVGGSRSPNSSADGASSGCGFISPAARRHLANLPAAALASPTACRDAGRCVAMCEAYGRVCPREADRAAAYAQKHVEHLFRESQVFVSGPNGAGELPFEHRLDREDLRIGQLLGTGGFCNVYACTVPGWTSSDLSRHSNDDHDAVSERHPRHSDHGAAPDDVYAIKTLRRQIMCDPATFRHGAADLAVEAHFLQALSHPHIVKLHAIPRGSLRDVIAAGTPQGFFLVIDRLVETLDRRIEAWHQQQERHHGNLLSRRTQEFRDYKRLELAERLRVAFGIADAMEYLHSRRIVYRDLKPDNCGCDRDGVVKLFDFGLAKELKPHRATDDGRYLLSGNTGSRRYMAVEVALGEPYNATVDNYSFGIMLWEMCAAEKPFLEYNAGRHMQQVVLGGERPPMDAKHSAFWPLPLQWLMSRCWAEDPKQRPSFTVVKETLQEILADRNGQAGTPASQPRSVSDTPKSSAVPPSAHATTSPGHATHGLAALLFHHHHHHHHKSRPSEGGFAPAPGSPPTTAVPPPTAAALAALRPAGAPRSGQRSRSRSWGMALLHKKASG